MLKDTDLIKMAMEETTVDPATQKNPVRKAYDAVTSGATAAAGAVGGAIAGIQSLDNKAPVRNIP